MTTPDYMSGAQLEAAETISPDDILASLTGYVIEGGDIDPTVYDQAMGRCEPPMSEGQFEDVIQLCIQGVRTRHMPKTPIDHSRHGRQSVELTTTESHFAALLGAASVRLNNIES